MGLFPLEELLSSRRHDLAVPWRVLQCLEPSRFRKPWNEAHLRYIRRCNQYTDGSSYRPVCFKIHFLKTSHGGGVSPSRMWEALSERRPALHYPHAVARRRRPPTVKMWIPPSKGE